MEYVWYFDKPIRNRAEDILGRGVFVDALAQVITECPENEGFVIGLEGPWGSGKTSFLHLLEEKIKSKVVIRRLDAWNSVSPDMLIEEFLGEFISEAGEIKPEKFAKCKSLLRKLVSPIKTISINGSYAGVGAGMSVETKESKDEKGFEALSTCKKKFYEAVNGRADRKPIVYFIDDIDRMSDENIALLFQLVKAIADFPNVIYVLAYDREIVAQALNRVQEDRGEEYLHKIIQIPFKLPQIEYGMLLDYLDVEFKKITSKSLPGRENESIRYCFWTEGIGGCLKSVRDCKQLLSVFQNKYMILEKNCNVLDLIGISAMQAFAPVSCALMQAQIVHILELGQLPADSNSETVKDFFDRILSATPFHLRTSIGRILGVLFPGFGDAFSAFCRELRMDESFRIYKPEYAERYFKLHVSGRHITEQEVHEILQYRDIHKIDEKMQELNNELRLTYFLERATVDWDENALWESARLFLSSISQMDLVQEDTSFYAKRIHDVAMGFFEKVVLEHRDIKRNQVFLKLFAENRDIGLGMICECIQRWASEDMGFSAKYKVGLAILNKRIKDESLEQGFSDNKFLNAVVKLWYKLDETACCEYLNCDAAAGIAWNYGRIRAVLQSGVGIGSGEITRWWKLDEILAAEIQNEWMDNAKKIIKSGIIKDKCILQDIVAFLIIQERQMNIDKTLMEEEVDTWLLNMQKDC